jgi:hypothetical protein
VGVPLGLVDGSCYETAHKTVAPAGTRNEKRDAYDSALLQRLAGVSASTSDEALVALVKESWADARRFASETASAKPAAATV